MLFNFKKKHKYINGTRGVISIFLALLMAPFTMIAGALMDVARVYSAVSIFDEALCNASNSTLGTYEPYLKKRFGLLAIKQSNSSTPTEEGVQEFINGMFNDYMQVNCGSLPGAYNKDNIETQAAGVYPLSDLSIMKTQVLEYSKYNIPAKFSADVIDLSDLIGKFEKLIPGYDTFDTLTKGMGTVDDALGMGDAIGKLYTAVSTQTDCKNNYETAHENFEESITEYNEANEEYEEAIEALEAAQEALNNAEDEEDKADLQSAYDSAKVAADNAKTALDSAKSDVLSKKSTYLGVINDLIGSVEDVRDEKNNLRDKIEGITDDVIDGVVDAHIKNKEEIIKENNELVEDREKKIKSANDEISALKKEMDSANKTEKDVENHDDISDGQKEDIADDFDDLRTDRTDKTNGYEKDVKAMKTEIESINKISDKFKDENTLIKEAKEAGKNSKEALSDYEKVLMDSGYNKIIDDLKELSANVSSFDLESDSGASDGELYVSVDNLLLYENIVTFEESVSSQVTGKTGIKIFWSIASFWSALVNIGLSHDPKLNAIVNKSYYSGMGGLPSDYGESYNPYADSDRKMSESYKKAMGKFSVNDDAYSGNLLDDIMSLVSEIRAFIELITKEHPSLLRITEVISWVKRVANSTKTIVALLKSICTNFSFSNLISSLYMKSLPAGYIYYNIPCRTNYEDFSSYKGLTSPDSLIVTDSRSFCGAEYEYILCGGLSEISNQENVFWAIYIIRIVLNIIPVVTDTELNTFTSAIMSIPVLGPIVGVIVVVFFLLAEPLIDTVLLCGGQTVPLYKTCVYLMPSGIKHLVNKLLNIVSEAAKNEAAKQYSDDVHNELTNIARTVTKNDDLNLNSLKTDEPPSNDDGLFSIKYDTYLFLLTTLIVDEATTYKRLADIVQMECSQNAYESGSGQFCLAYSYTYLRASGSFDARMFMPISGESYLSADKRVIYQGY